MKLALKFPIALVTCETSHHQHNMMVHTIMKKTEKMRMVNIRDACNNHGKNEKRASEIFREGNEILGDQVGLGL